MYLPNLLCHLFSFQEYVWLLMEIRNMLHTIRILIHKSLSLPFHMQLNMQLHVPLVWCVREQIHKVLIIFREAILISLVSVLTWTSYIIYFCAWIIQLIFFHFPLLLILTINSFLENILLHVDIDLLIADINVYVFVFLFFFHITGISLNRRSKQESFCWLTL
jgi:hypothetical protein